MLKTYFSNLNFNKSTGNFRIPKQIFSIIPHDLAHISTSLTNLTFEKKQKGSNLEVNNYRPISFLS